MDPNFQDTKPIRYVLVLQCADTKGIVATVSAYLLALGCSITESHHFHDADSRLFFMRTAFVPENGQRLDIGKFDEGFFEIAKPFNMQWSLRDMTVRPKLLIAVSKFGHCLYDLLHRWRSGLLPVDIPAVVSNHDDMRSFVEWSGLPFYHLPANKADKVEQENRFMELVETLEIDLVVLARYMQILSPNLCQLIAGRCINIHHSFLPSFKGAKPYHQAYFRGVKIIGATAHYVTTELDEGPIIEQGVERVSHAQTPEDLITIGRDIECAVLARAVSWHIDNRLIINGKRTVVFN